MHIITLFQQKLLANVYALCTDIIVYSQSSDKLGCRSVLARLSSECTSYIVATMRCYGINLMQASFIKQTIL